MNIILTYSWAGRSERDESMRAEESALSLSLSLSQRERGTPALSAKKPYRQSVVMSAGQDDKSAVVTSLSMQRGIKKGMIIEG